MSTSFTAQIFQNPYLAAGADEVHAVVSVAAAAAAGGDGRVSVGGNTPLVFGFLIDCSGSMGEDGGTRLRHAKVAVREAIRLLREDAYFFVVSGSDGASVVAPISQATPANKARADAAVARLQPGGGTQMSNWLIAAEAQFPREPGFVRQALLLTDGKNATQDAEPLQAALAACEGRFQCDARGVGVDWQVDQLRAVAAPLLGTVDIIAEPSGLAADFQGILARALGRAVAEASLRLWTPVGATVEFCKQVSPDLADLTAKGRPGAQNPQQTRDFPLGAWSREETREYHLCIRVKAGGVGQRMLAGRVSVVVSDGTNETKATEAQILATWTDDEGRSAVLNPEVAHYTGQGELAQNIQEGLEARRVGDEEQATRKLGRAVQLAAESGNEGTTKLLRKVVEVVDEERGTVKLRARVDEADAMALDTRSTKTTRIAR